MPRKREPQTTEAKSHHPVDWGTGSVREIAQVLGCTPRRIQQLASEGVIPRPPKRGVGYDLAATIAAYIEHLKLSAETPDKLSEEVRLKRAQADRAELEILVKKGGLIDSDEATANLQAAAQTFTAGLKGCAARITRKLNGNATMQRMIEEEHGRVRERTAARLKTLADKADAAKEKASTH